MLDPVICMLGNFRVAFNGCDLKVSAPKAQGVLACLASAPNQVVGADRLSVAIWGEDAPISARNAIQVYISQWRRASSAAGSPFEILTSNAGYELRIDPTSVDTHRYETLVSQGLEALRGGRSRHCLEALRQAAELWRGPVLQGLDELPIKRWLEPNLENLWREACISEAQARVDLGQAEIAVALLKKCQLLFPESERLLVLLMHSLYLDGDQRQALEVYETARRRLQLSGLDPSPEMREMESRILQHDPELIARGRSALGSRFPAPVGLFVDRGPLIEKTIRILSDGTTRLVTFTGFGGVGKTRSSLEVARLMDQRLGLSVRFVSLSGVSDSSGLYRAVAEALKIDTRAAEGGLIALAKAFPDHPILLIIDRAEHLLSNVGALVTSLLANAAKVSLLVTSRAPLDVVGEVVAHVPSLRTQRISREETTDIPAVAFFLMSMSLTDVDQVSAPDLVAIERICHEVDGNPLAIEIAASRARSLGPQQTEAAVSNDLAFLRRSQPTTEAVHGSVEAMVDWSFSLLAEGSRSALEDLSQFPGGFAAPHLGALLPDLTFGAALEVLDELASQNLVRRQDSPGEARYRMPNLVRELISKRVSIDRRRQSWGRYEGWLLGHLGEIRTTTSGFLTRFREVESEEANLRALILFLLGSGGADGLRRVVPAIYDWWMYGGRSRELLEWLELLTNDDVDNVRVSTLHLLAGRVAAQRGLYERSDFHLGHAAETDNQTPDGSVVAARISRAENEALRGSARDACIALRALESHDAVLQDEALRCRLLLAQAIAAQLAGEISASDGFLDALEDVPLWSQWIDAEVKGRVVRADNLRLRGRISESEAVLRGLDDRLANGGIPELEELVAGMRSSLFGIAGDAAGVLVSGLKCLASMPSDARDIESVLRVVLALRVSLGADHETLRTEVNRLVQLFLTCFPTPRVLAHELSLFPEIQMVGPFKVGLPERWTETTDNVLYELRRAVATGSAR